MCLLGVGPAGLQNKNNSNKNHNMMVMKLEENWKAIVLVDIIS